MYKKMLVPVNDSDRAFKALRCAKDLAAVLQARLVVLAVLRTARPQDAAEEAAQVAALQRKIEERMPEISQVADFALRWGKNIPAGIIAAADELDCALIVLGSRRLPGARAVIGRSISNAVISSCPKPVLIV